jgi:hypothetical protein
MMYKYFKDLTTKDLIQDIIGKDVTVINETCINCNICNAVFYSIPNFNVDNLKHLKKWHFNNCKCQKLFIFTKSEEYLQRILNIDAITARETFNRIPSCSYIKPSNKIIKKNKASSGGKKIRK